MCFGVKPTRCLYHALPLSPSRSVNARSAIISRSLSSRTLSPLHIDVQLPCSSCTVEYFLITCPECGEEVMCICTIWERNSYLYLVVYLSSCFLEFIDGIDHGNNGEASMQHLIFQFFYTFLFKMDLHIRLIDREGNYCIVRILT